MTFGKHVVAKVILVPYPLTKQLKWDNAGHREMTINNAVTVLQMMKTRSCNIQRFFHHQK